MKSLGIAATMIAGLGALAPANAQTLEDILRLLIQQNSAQQAQIDALTAALTPRHVYKFAGYSTETMDGLQGRATMYAACQVDHGPLARTCTVTEFVLSPNIVDPPSVDGAWIQPVKEAHPLGQFGGDREVNCSDWKPGGGLDGGAVVEPGGRLSARNCIETSIPITCCVPWGQ